MKLVADCIVPMALLTPYQFTLLC